MHLQPSCSVERFSVPSRIPEAPAIPKLALSHHANPPLPLEQARPASVGVRADSKRRLAATIAPRGAFGKRGEGQCLSRGKGERVTRTVAILGSGARHAGSAHAVRARSEASCRRWRGVGCRRRGFPGSRRLQARGGAGGRRRGASSRGASPRHSPAVTERKPLRSREVRVWSGRLHTQLRQQRLASRGTAGTRRSGDTTA